MSHDLEDVLKIRAWISWYCIALLSKSFILQHDILKTLAVVLFVLRLFNLKDLQHLGRCRCPQRGHGCSGGYHGWEGGAKKNCITVSNADCTLSFHLFLISIFLCHLYFALVHVKLLRLGHVCVTGREAQASETLVILLPVFIPDDLVHVCDQPSHMCTNHGSAVQKVPLKYMKSKHKQM